MSRSLPNRAMHAVFSRINERRPWYRQVLSAPGWYTGYSPKILPGVREGIEEERWKDSEAEAVRVGRALESEAAALDRMTNMLER